MSPSAVRVVADDGFELPSTTFGEPGAARAGVVIAPAMGVEQRYYAPFAGWLAARGSFVATFDYRGTGAARPEAYRKSLAGFETDVTTWATRDCRAIADFVASRIGSRPLLWIGHSLGGQIFGLVPNRERASAILMVAAASGYKGYSAPSLRRKSLFLWHGIVPLSIAIKGYFPGAKLGILSDLPAGAMQQWRRWCLNPAYLVGVEGEPVRRSYAGVRQPILSLLATDDEYVTAKAGEALLALYPGAPRELRLVAPGDIGERRIGHFGFFPKRFEESLWPLAERWLAAQVS